MCLFSTRTKKLRAIDVNKKIEKKNGLSYLSWAFERSIMLLQSDAAANWEYPPSLMYGRDDDGVLRRHWLSARR